MNSRMTINLVLGAAIIVLALIVIFEPGKEKPADGPKLTALTTDALRRISIERTGKDTITLEKQGDQWWITAPLKMPANDFRVSAVLRLASTATHAQFARAGQELKKFELDSPKLRVRLDDQLIEFGGLNPLDNRRYVVVNDTIHLIGDDAYPRLMSEPASFVSTALLPEQGANLTEIKLPNLSVRKDKDSGQWSILPAVANLSADEINKFVDDWRHAQALQVAPYSGQPTGQSVTLNFTGALPALQFEVLAGQDELILGRKDAGVQYHFTSETGQRMFTPKAGSKNSDNATPQDPPAAK